MSNAVVSCGNCGAVNDAAAIVCAACGALLAAYASPAGSEPPSIASADADAEHRSAGTSGSALVESVEAVAAAAAALRATTESFLDGPLPGPLTVPNDPNETGIQSADAADVDGSDENGDREADVEVASPERGPSPTVEPVRAPTTAIPVARQTPIKRSTSALEDDPPPDLGFGRGSGGERIVAALWGLPPQAIVGAGVGLFLGALLVGSADGGGFVRGVLACGGPFGLILVIVGAARGGTKRSGPGRRRGGR